jgi:hypothetical protein
MSKLNRIAQTKISWFVLLTMGAATFAPIFSLAPASAQLFPSRDSDREEYSRDEYSRGAVVPEGATIPVMYKDAKKVLVTDDETAPLTLQVAANVKNRRGQVLIPYGSEIEGEIQPADGGSQFVAQKIIIETRDGDTIEQPIDATSDVVTRRERVEKGASAGEILEGAAIGGAAAAVLSGIFGDIDIEEVLGGAGLGALAGWVFNEGQEAELISINPNTDLTLTLNSDLELER